MTRFMIVLLFALFACSETNGEDSAVCAMQLIVGTGNSIRVRLPCMDRADVIGVISTFLSRGGDSKKVEAILKTAGEVTLELTSSRTMPSEAPNRITKPPSAK